MTHEHEGPPSSRWLVYQVDAAPLGPIATEDVADAILAGVLPVDTWVSAPSASKWLRATDVPVIASLLAGTPTRRHQDATTTGLATEICAPLRFDDTPGPPETLPTPGRNS